MATPKTPTSSKTHLFPTTFSPLSPKHARVIQGLRSSVKKRSAAQAAARDREVGRMSPRVAKGVSPACSPAKLSMASWSSAGGGLRRSDSVSAGNAAAAAAENTQSGASSVSEYVNSPRRMNRSKEPMASPQATLLLPVQLINKVIKQYDRFIPNRLAMDIPSSQYQVTQAVKDSIAASTSSTTGNNTKYLDAAALAYQEEIAKACGVDINKRILAFQSEPPRSATAEPLRTSWNRKKTTGVVPPAHRRRINIMPERVLDAPGLVDDYYLNLLDWSTENLVAVALEDTVYVWNATTGAVTDFCKLDETGDGSTAPSSISSLQWSSDGSHLAIGTGRGNTQIWDLESAIKVRTMSGHASRVGVLSWDKHIVSSGSRDGSIWHHDVRVAQHKVSELLGHTGEVCGLKWRADGALLASGGNDNLVNIWDARSSVPKFTKTNHNAAVKAIGWCPWQLNLVATGGGTNDKMVHFWNSTTGSKLSSIDTGSQVTSIIWSREYKELVTSHGFPDNQLTIWGYPSLARIVDLPGHDSRILCASMSPDGQTVVTGASDENLKFWKVFERREKGAVGGLVGAMAAKGVGAGQGKVAMGDSTDEELTNMTRKMTIR
ncbi:ubiquitin-protein transferase activating protein [Chytridiales sp. JEL 0842]|nr:ubiquitin-protein transferase activating protein [Chytridiales sp. JEL 0842]